MNGFISDRLFGYLKSVRDAHHYRIIQSLLYTIKADAGLLALFDQFRKKRNISGYDQAGTISDQEAKEMLVLANHLRNVVEEWLYTKHPDLMTAKENEK